MGCTSNVNEQTNTINKENNEFQQIKISENESSSSNNSSNKKNKSSKKNSKHKYNIINIYSYL